MFTQPKVGSIVSFTTKHLAWYYYEQAKKTKQLEYKNVRVLPPLWEENGIFFIATGDIKNPLACISLRCVKQMTIDGKQATINKDVPESERITYKLITGSKGDSYTLTLRGGKAVHCTCPGFVFHHGNCKHIRDAK